MAYPKDIGVIDLMMNIPGEDSSQWYEFLKPLLLDKESREQFKMPAQYMFKDIPQTGKLDDYISWTVEQMDKFNIEKAMLGISGPNSRNLEAVRRYPDRFFASVEANPNNGMDEVRKIEHLYHEYGIKAVTGFPSGLCPQVPINDKKWYPIYAKCVELDLPICVCVGVPGPRVPMYPQKVEHIDEVCWFFPELKFVMRHGAEPWTELAVKLMLKYPNLYYSTSAFAPRHYPKAIIDYANTRGADKVMYAGYFPMGLSLERIFGDMEQVPFKDEVWPKFLRENAKRVFGV
ncbi:MAG: amidohydrolase [Candidatus Dadabacteria bacterium]|nr:MAG: amidohydrolase [Candidatus Dadabacteria bacterium]